MLALGVAPNASQLRPVRMGRSLLELLEHDQVLEGELVKLYSAAVAHCHRQGDHDNRMFFQALLQEEQGHGQELGEWITKLKGMGLN
jgi:bacterioferritin